MRARRVDATAARQPQDTQRSCHGTILDPHLVRLRAVDAMRIDRWKLHLCLFRIDQ